MDQNQLNEQKVGDACSRLLALEDFKVFIDEMSRRRNVVAEQAMFGKADDYAEYLAVRGIFLGLSEVIGAPQQLVDNAREALKNREQDDE